MASEEEWMTKLEQQIQGIGKANLKKGRRGGGESACLL